MGVSDTGGTGDVEGSGKGVGMGVSDTGTVGKSIL